MSLKFGLCVFAVVVLGRLSAADDCPPNEDINPCTCKNVNKQAAVTCTGIPNSEVLREALAGIKDRVIETLEVKESNLGDVPGYIFKDTHIHDLRFSYTKLTSLGDEKNLPFSGLENSLRRLTIVEGFWDYDKPLTKPIPLSHLKKLTYLNLENNVIPKLGDDWFQNGPVTLKDLYISTALCKEVGPNAFSKLKNLRSFHFTGNAVTLKRSALPTSALFLDSLDLSENEIVELPTDIFTGLPSLKYVYLNNNGIHTIPENTWKSILSQLDFVFISSNPLVCDSKMKWIIEGKLHEKFVGECALPHALTGKAIESLTIGDLSG